MERISFQAVVSHSRLEFHRNVRRQIGRIVRPDDPEAELCIPKPVQFDAEAARSTLDGWLRNAKAGLAPKLIDSDSYITIHLILANKPRFKVQLGRLRRRFPLPDRMTLYHFNEGRKYAAQISA